jgi:sigma-B regulation protein RsbU (phosphoserine phosphatase)
MVFGKAHSDGNVGLCIAGHNPPLLIQDGKVQTINATGVPVGLFCESEYELSSINLRKGDSLILYTDGLTEASINEIEYGEERLKQLLEKSIGFSAKSLLNAIINDQKSFLNDATLFDDITISVIAKA